MIKGKISYEVWNKEKPDLSHLQIISTKAYVHIPKDLYKKLDFNSKTGIFVGYDDRNQYRIWDPAKQDVIVSHDVEFDESATSIDEQQLSGTDKVRTISAMRESSPKPFEPRPSEPEPFEPKSDDEDIGDEAEIAQLSMVSIAMYFH